jgi:peptidoglycan/LPS O-acetylase OafA/YrhL
MVAVFFVAGGYVFSIKPIRLMSAGKDVELHRNLVSSLFRRGIRLYIPAVVATFGTMLTVGIGAWEFPRQFTRDKRYIYYSDTHPERLSNFWTQFKDWLSETHKLTNFFKYYNNDGFMLPYYPKYDPHLWTVPFEYRSGMILGLALLTLSRCKTRVRIFFMGLIVLFCISWDRWELVCFFGGALLCDIDMISATLSEDGIEKVQLHHELENLSDEEKGIALERVPLGNSSTTRSSRTNSRSRSPSIATGEVRSSLPQNFHDAFDTVSSVVGKLNFFLFLFSLYLLATPNLEIETTPGYNWITHVIPRSYTDRKRYPHTLGALLITFTLMRSPMLQGFFNTSFAQYLGKISYSLYIVHGPLIHVVGYSLTPSIWNLIGMEGWQWSTGLLLGTSVSGVCVAIVAHWFNRLVDQKGVSWARKIERFGFDTRE